MKIEVAIEGREPYGQPITKDKTVIGSGDESDLVLKIKGISRKHAIVVMEDDVYYVIDQGSAAGTFINEEQLVPGQRTEFNSFFPIKLGPYVTLSLLSDEEESKTFEFAKALPAEPKREQVKSISANPNIISPSSGRKEVTSPASGVKKGIEGREGIHTRKRTAKAPQTNSADSRLMQRTIMFAVVFAVGGAGAFFYFRQSPDEQVVNPVVVEAVAVAEKTTKASLLAGVELFYSGPSDTDISQVLEHRRCSTTIEMELCQKLTLPDAKASLSGLSIGATNIVFSIPTVTARQLIQKFQTNFYLTEDKLNAWEEKPIESRDLIAVYLMVLADTGWSFITKEHQWLYGVILDEQGGVSMTLYADAQAIKKTLLAKKDFLFSSIVGQQGPEALAPVSGSLRLVEKKL